ncbi:MAG: AI-2E family transporter [Chloroflexota bacterium]
MSTGTIRRIQRSDVDWQRALFIPLTILAWLAVAIIAGWLLGHVVKTILTLVLSGVIAFALTPLVSLFERRMPRGLAIGFAYVLGFGIVFGLGALLVVTVAAQITNLVHALPHYTTVAQSHEPQLLRFLKPFGVTAVKLHTAQRQLTSAISTVGTTAAKDSLGIVTSVLGTIVDIVLVLILSVYLTANGTKIAQSLRREAPASQRMHTILTIAIVNQVVGGYVRGQLTLATLIGTLVGVGMLLLHVPYAVLLGVLAFFMEFIPVIGVLVSGAICIGIALFQGWLTAVLVLVYFVIVHIIEGDVVGPRIMGHAVGIHPATALIALVAGTELFGIWGALFGAPIAGLLQAFATAAYREWHGGDPRDVLHAAIEEEKQDLMEDAEREEKQDIMGGARPLAH